MTPTPPDRLAIEDYLASLTDAELADLVCEALTERTEP
ncbi:hypothetical protein RAJCM14343_2738 [Rhodococcus aetherivorans]|uniref:Anti-sigma factor n=1 Tax=Rhodococcus aetherivorans TaxID=191292 RepID=A0ABQ0YLU1_9NOCA|nr:hypothetical protein RR21198_1384 [Rhodococcus rhodochrous ATCC 21198]GES37483.1 hypothetical protein RAJCM14343_2738 [Rhodococcus aetherivorans]